MKKNIKLFAFLIIILSQQRLTGQNTIGNFLNKDLKSIQNKLQPQQEVDTITEYNKLKIKTKSDVLTTVMSQNIEIKIGSQVYMGKNLDVSYYRNGDPIPQVTDLDKWAALTTGAWCYYKNESSYGEVYGKLYNWYAVNDPRGIAPTGWHVPSNDEWGILDKYLGGGDKSGVKLKAHGSKDWEYINSDLINQTGFAGMPSGSLSFFGMRGMFIDEGISAVWWSSTSINGANDSAWVRFLYEGSDYFAQVGYGKNDGYSIRCIKD